MASFFVRRVDTLTDNRLTDIGTDEALALRGKAGIANSKQAYRLYEELFGEDSFGHLAARGARPQRLLWASTGTKNPAYSSTLYVDELIGPNTVNTIPPATLDAFRDHGRPAATLESNLEEAGQVMSELEALGISLADVTQELEDAGVKAFADAFASLLATIESRRAVPA